MKNKINLVEILKNCPKGMELDCPLLDNVEFEELDFNFHNYPIVIRNSKTNTEIYLTEYGQFVNEENYKCIIFPKGKNTWEGFVPPCKFKDGDIVASRSGDYIFMLKKAHTYKDDDVYKVYNGTCYFGLSSSKFLLTKEGKWYFDRLATEEEKQKLFQAVKDNGYRWNNETKTLEKLRMFKVGDRVRLKLKPNYVYTIHSLTWDDNNKLAYRLLPDNDKHLRVISLIEQNEYELIPNKFDITLKPFDKVLVRRNNYGKWEIDFFGFHDKEYYHTAGACKFEQCIPYEGNEHLRGTTNDCDEFYKTWK